VVHRDLKPANLFVVGEGDSATIKVVDFGLSKAPEVHRRASDDAALTTSGSMIGSPMYMAPEQIRDAKTADARGDVWALGVVLYEMLAGKPPFSATTVSGVLAAIMVDEVPSLAAHGVPASLERVVLDCLEKRQAKRVASAEALLQRLACWQEEEAVTPETSVSGTVLPLPARARARARRWPMAAGAAAVVAASVALAAAAASSPTLLTARASALAPLSVTFPAAPELPAEAAAPASVPSAQSSAVAPAVGTAAQATLPRGTPTALPPRPRPGAAQPEGAPPAGSAAPAEVIFGKETEQRQ
jgi:serine/threonine-protein kinase